jgi:hypothetical protein
MKFKNTLSVQMSRAIKDNTTTNQRDAIAAIHEISIHTLNSVINRQRNVSSSNKNALIDIIEVAIHSANEKGETLSQYVEDIKKATH